MTAVLLEHITIAAVSSDAVVMRIDRVPLEPESDPVAAGFAWDTDALSHSTSWRFDNAAVVLTFVHVRADGTPIDGTWTGSPEALEDEPVACHAVRHLHFLRHTDEEVAGVTGIPHFWAFAEKVADQHYPAVAGLLSQHDLDGMDFSI